MRALALVLLCAPAAAQTVLRPVPGVPALVAPAAPLRAPALVLSFSLSPLAAPLSPLPAVRPAPRAFLAPTVPAAGPVAPKASPEELAFAAGAAARLAELADDIGAERGQRSTGMTGRDFLGLLEAGRERWASQAQAPSPGARRAADTVQASVLRVVKALVKPDEPLQGQVRRALAVWNVFNQEMAAAAEKGTLEAVEAEARLFAEQVERSV